MKTEGNSATEHEQKNRKRNGMLVSLVVHALFLLVMLGFTLEAPFPPPLEQGIAIQFGGELDDNGISDNNKVSRESPTKDEPQTVSHGPMEQKQEVDRPRVQTQDLEDAPAMDSKKDVPKKEKQTNPLDNRALFPGSRSAEKNSQAGATGQRGSPDGKPQGGKDGNPSNNGQTGFQDFSLKGRNVLTFDKPDDQSQIQGIVVINISVNLQGQVVQAELNTKKSTISRPDIVDKCKNSARKFKFSRADATSAPPIQMGNITFKFELD